MSPYKQMCPSKDEWPNKCPRAIEGRKCGKTSVHKLDRGPKKHKLEFKILRGHLLDRDSWTKYSTADRLGKCLRLSELSCCNPCNNTHDNMIGVRDWMLEDLRLLHEPPPTFAEMEELRAEFRQLQGRNEELGRENREIRRDAAEAIQQRDGRIEVLGQENKEIGRKAEEYAAECRGLQDRNEELGKEAEESKREAAERSQGRIEELEKECEETARDAKDCHQLKRLWRTLRDDTDRVEDLQPRATFRWAYVELKERVRGGVRNANDVIPLGHW